MLTFIQAHTPWLIPLLGLLAKLMPWPKAKPTQMVQVGEINVTIHLQVVRSPEGIASERQARHGD